MKKFCAPTTLQRDLMKLKFWKTLLFEIFFFLWIFLWLDFVFVIATLEIFLPNHTWNIIISSKLYFVIVKTKINQTWLHNFFNKWYRVEVIGSNPRDVTGGEGRLLADWRVSRIYQLSLCSNVVGVWVNAP